MRILHFLTQKPGFTGSGYYLRALFREADEVGHRVAAVVGLSPGEHFEMEPLFGVRFETPELPFPVVGMSDVMPYRSSIWSELTEQQLHSYRVAFERAAQRAVDEFQPDILHCHHLWLLTALVRELFPTIRVVASCHGTGLRQQEKLPHLFSRIQPALDRLDHIYFLTRAQQAGSPCKGLSSSVVGAGFNSRTFHLQGRKDNTLPRVLYAGKLSYSKGCRELLQAVAPHLGESFQLTMVGSGHGKEAEEIRAAGKELGVDFTGRLSQEELAREMRKSDVFVLPSYYEGLALVLAEALACGCKVVVNRLPGLEDWLLPELVESGWVKLIELPVLQDVDKPAPEAVPEYVERLRIGLLEQCRAELSSPGELPDFLSTQSWSGVYSRLAEHYGAPV